MPIYFPTDTLAKQEGWTFTTAFTEDNTAETKARFHAIGEYELGCLRTFFQTILVVFLRLITIDCALEYETVRVWNEELEKGKVVEEIFCRHLAEFSAQPIICQSGWEWIDIETATSTTKYIGDVILLPGSVQQWNWKWKGSDFTNQMQHLPGIRQDDIDTLLLPSEPDVVILSKGRESKLNIALDVRDHMRDKKIELHVLKTEDAITKYKAICAQGTKRVAALIHTTC